MAGDPTGRISHLPDMHRGVAWKEPCRVATTANITIATALNNGDSIDGVTLATGDRVLVKDQSTGSQNGIYIVAASPGRAFDMDQDSTTSVPASEVMGAIIYVIAGTANAGTLWRNTNTTVPILGTTALTFAAVSGGASGAAGGDLSGTYPNPSVVDDSHSHTASTLPASTNGGARVYNSGTVAVGASTETVVTFDSERSDSAAYHSTSSNTGRLTIPTGGAGRYTIAGSVEWAASALGTLRRLSLRLNGTTYIAKDEITSIINAVLPQTVATIYDLADADYVELVAFQDTIGSINLGASGNYSPEFALSTGGSTAAFIGCRAVSNANTNLTSGTATLVALAGTDEYDTDGFHDPATNNTRLTVPTGRSGKYHVNANIVLTNPTNNMTDRRLIVRKTSGGTPTDYLLLREYWASTTSTAIYMTAGLTIALTAGDYVEMLGLTDVASSTGSGWLELAFMGT